MQTDEKIVSAMSALEPMHELPRSGWVMRGVGAPESIAEHSFGVAMIAMMLSDGLREEGVKFNGEKVLRYALLHDAAEAFTGDIPAPAKTKVLRQALAEVEGELIQKHLPATLADEFLRFQKSKSIEARLARCADKIHLLFKALTYLKQGRGDVREFFINPRSFEFRESNLPDRVRTLLIVEAREFLSSIARTST